MQKACLASLLFFLPRGPLVKKVTWAEGGAELKLPISARRDLSLHQPDPSRAICKVPWAQPRGCSQPVLPQPSCRDDAVKSNIHRDGEGAWANRACGKRDLGSRPYSSSCILGGSAEGEQVQVTDLSLGVFDWWLWTTPNPLYCFCGITHFDGCCMKTPSI